MKGHVFFSDIPEGNTMEPVAYYYAAMSKEAFEQDGRHIVQLQPKQVRPGVYLVQQQVCAKIMLHISIGLISFCSMAKFNLAAKIKALDRFLRLCADSATQLTPPQKSFCWLGFVQGTTYALPPQTDAPRLGLPVTARRVDTLAANTHVSIFKGRGDATAAKFSAL